MAGGYFCQNDNLFPSPVKFTFGNKQQLKHEFMESKVQRLL